MKIFHECAKYIAKNSGRFFCYCFVALVIKVLSLVSPYLTGNFINGLISENDMAFVYKYCLIVAVLALLSLTLGYASNRLYVKLQMAMGAAYNLDVINHLQKLPVSRLNGKDLTHLNQQVNGDTNSLIIFCLNAASSFAVNVIILILLFVVCFCINSSISFYFLIFSIFYIAIYNLAKKKKFKTTFRLYESQNKFFSALFEQLAYIGFIRSQGVEEFFRNRVKEPYKELFKATLDNQKFDFLLSGIDSVLFMTAQITLYIIGSRQILIGAFSVGSFITFSAYFSMIISFIRYFYSFGSTYQETMVSYRRLKTLLEMEEERCGSSVPDEINQIEIHNLSFSYDETAPDQNMLFHSLSKTVKRGEICGITGKNGSGKTTMIKILLGFYNEHIPEQAVMINGEDLLSVDLHPLRKHKIGYADQDPVLFNGSLLENILLDRTADAETMTALKQLASLLCIESLVFSQTETTDVKSLSGGERQKIAVMRALVKNPEIIILDEPTSAMDTLSRNNLLCYLRQIKQEKIILIITHDSDIASICDNMIVME